ncbi:MAG: hypothetical protein M0T73_13075 [Deltaproteobacteria bacterium]|nr:hypothetical protein [Deltaproteobacteria bacterium]
MTKMRFSLAVSIMLLGIVLANFGVFVIPAISHEDIEQQRDRCIRDCHQDYPDDEETYWEQSSECVAKCQKTYWRNLHQQLNGTRTK